VKFLNIDELARVVIFREVVEETTDTFVKFESLSLREADKFIRDVPLETDEHCNECKVVVSLLLMPGDAQGFDTTEDFGTIVIIAEVAFDKGT